MFGIESYKNKDELLEEQYKAKYLKYKQKYLELNQTGGLPSYGIHAYLTTEEKANQLVALYNNKCKKRDGSDTQFNIDIAGQLTGIADTVALTGTINVTNNIENNPQFGTLIQAKITYFNKMIIEKNNKFVDLINSEKNKLAQFITTEKDNYTKSFNEHLIKCNTPQSSEIENLLNDNAYIIKKGTKKIELIHNITFMDKAKKEEGTELKKNSSTIDPCRVDFNPDTPNSFKDILLKIQSSNIKKPNYTVPTHYVLIDLSVGSSKLVGDGKPKPIPQ